MNVASKSAAPLPGLWFAKTARGSCFIFDADAAAFASKAGERVLRWSAPRRASSSTPRPRTFRSPRARSRRYRRCVPTRGSPDGPDPDAYADDRGGER